MTVMVAMAMPKMRKATMEDAGEDSFPVYGWPV